MKKFVVCTETEGGEIFWNGSVKKGGAIGTAKTFKGARKYDSYQDALDSAALYDGLSDYKVVLRNTEEYENNAVKLRINMLRQRMPDKSPCTEYASQPYQIAEEALDLCDALFRRLGRTEAGKVRLPKKKAPPKPDDEEDE